MAVKRYDGSAWQTVAGLGAQGAAATSSSIATWVKTATGGETSVSGNDDNSQPLSYTVGQELVFINGTLLKRGSDYTATTGNSITGLTALAANDVVTVWTVNAFSVTNAISNTIVDAKGDLLTATGADVPARLAVGTNDYVLTADSSTATGLKWAAAAGGGTSWTLITNANISSGNALNLTGLGSYDNYLLLFYNISTNSIDTLNIRLNNSTSSIYRRVNWVVGSFPTAGLSNNSFTLGIDTTQNNAAFSFEVSGCKSTTGYKDFTFGAYRSQTTTGYTYGRGIFESNSSITSIDVVFNANDFDNGTYYLYGSN